ncbi:type II secretion system protein GspE [Victivallaceae bacterium BBE-744-WT-12]|jgi:general secretion pathway protein E/type IV pilus assembly protein PilB|uniref:protein-secreting ATPase n=2 Tax=Victivallis lenta TaxID=2606640 RepID=A0A844G5E5_9BACT|nr:type II secretion system protein GspE [Victivallales bacterium CCUG 44730]MBS1455040.1 type II secretion system ATPase GspE [Lentisphaeria bacterium]MST98586.1 type II secretion system protein GspE [Victivallis lenta]HBP07940.1 type II secretion system protein GspE [Lentisphaeria bacterium]HCH84458.1 type II secretion system protein GspE [Lentisphaeria bacterium]
MVTREQVARAREEAEASGGTLDPVECLKKDGSVREQDLLAMLAQQYGMEVLDLNSYEIPPEILECLTPEVASRYKVVPVMKHDDVLTIAMSDPTDMETLDALRYLLGTEVDAMVASKSQIDAILDRHYRTGADSVEGYLQEMTEDADLDTELVSNIGQAESLDDENAPIIRLVTQLIIDAFKMKASDIHLEPMEKRYRVRYRIDGALREVEGPPKYMQANFTSRVKIMARLDITEKRIPQDGRIQVTVGDRDIDLRVSSVPTVHGESIVMRILDKSSIQLDVPKLGFYADDLEIVNRIISLPDGIFLVTGPTGSGKTTSLYAFLNTINTTSRKIITVEDPVEYQLSGINQVQVDRHVEMTFAAALRSMLRQAPNIIMVGEIRDLETAEIAINAALTGHLVFSTLHTNDAPGAITRLVDMGVKPFLVATALRAVMAQRLLRRICPNCKAPYTPTATEIRMLGLSPEYLENHQFYKGKGCDRCGRTGYKGRIGIYEIFQITEDIGKLIFANEPTGVIRDAARRNGMRSLRDDAMRKAAAGISTLEEVIFVTLMDEN